MAAGECPVNVSESIIPAAIGDHKKLLFIVLTER